jgi:hypothetical protein
MASQISSSSEASVDVSKQIQDLQDGLVSPTPNLENQGMPFCLGHNL